MSTNTIHRPKCTNNAGVKKWCANIKILKCHTNTKCQKNGIFIGKKNGPKNNIA
jgi:hypothetical protein